MDHAPAFAEPDPADKHMTQHPGLLLPLLVGAVAVQSPAAAPQERQLTSSARNHMLDNNDNFSSD